jgi:hypothetical protein
MKYLKKFNEHFTSAITQQKSIDWNSEQSFVSDLEDIALELKDEGMIVDIRLNKSTSVAVYGFIKPFEYEVRISKPGFNKDLIKWSEIKDTVIRLTEYCYENGWSVRFWADGIEFLTGCKKEEDFTIGDGITQFSFRMLITRL